MGIDCEEQPSFLARGKSSMIGIREISSRGISSSRIASQISFCFCCFSEKCSFLRDFLKKSVMLNLKAIFSLTF